MSLTRASPVTDKFVLGMAMIVFLLVILGSPLNAEGIGESSAAFLRSNAGPRAIALGGAYSPVADDGYAMFWNPATMSNVRGHTLVQTYNRDFELIDRGIFGWTYPMSKNHTLGFGGRMIQAEDTVRREHETGETFKNYGASAGLYYALGSPMGFSLGLGIKTVRQKLYKYTTGVFALDGGLHYQGDHLQWGASVQNVGPDVSFKDSDDRDPMPRTYRTGLGFNFTMFSLPVMISTEATSYVPEQQRFASAGMEIQPFSVLDFRVGYREPLDHPRQDSSVHAGLGLSYRGITVDYSFSPNDILEDQHNFSLGLKFGPRPTS